MNLTDIKNKLKHSNNPSFAINFIIDNNPTAVSDNLDALGLGTDAPRTKKMIREQIQYLISEGRGRDVLFALNVPYVNSSKNSGGKMNYTSGLGKWLMEKQNERNMNPATPPSDVVSNFITD